MLNEEKSKCVNGSSITYNLDTNKVSIKGNKSDSCTIYIDVLTLGKKCNNKIVGDCFKENKNLENDLYFHDSNLAYSANDNSYRYAGSNPNNYVCLTDSCNEFYRIVGIFDNKIKLVKATLVYNHYYYNGDIVINEGSSTNNNTVINSNGPKNNNWAESNLNNNVLNSTYLNNLSFKNNILSVDWVIGGVDNTFIDKNVKAFYDAEISSNKKSAGFNAKIGLIYVSDFLYSSIPANWNNEVYSGGAFSTYDNSWLNENQNELTIMKVKEDTEFIFYITSNKGPSLNRAFFKADAPIITTEPVYYRPTFYINSNVKLTKGNGSSTDPYYFEF